MKTDLIVLGIETSCDETSVAVLKNGRTVLSNIISTQIDTHRLFGGVVPEIASRMHLEAMNPILEEALKEAGVGFDDLDVVCVTRGPGLVGALLVGMSCAKAICLSKSIPLVGVNHMEGHICANYISHPDLEPPFVSLVVSGGHTYLIEVMTYTTYRIHGSTRDDAVGESYDKVARTLGLKYPGGPEIDRIAKKGDPASIHFPRVMMDSGDYDFSFSGLKTAVLNYVNTETQNHRTICRENVAAAFQEAVVDVLEAKAFRLLEELGMDTLALSGGVAANSAIRERFQNHADAIGAKLYYPEMALCTDNAAMIASAGYFHYREGLRSPLSLETRANLSL